MPERNLAAEKFEQRLRRCFGIFLRQIVAAFDREAAQIWRPVAPAGKRVERGIAGQAAVAPDRQYGTADRLAGRSIRFIVGEIGGAAGAIVLAHGVNAQRVLIGGVIMRERTRVERSEER